MTPKIGPSKDEIAAFNWAGFKRVNEICTDLKRELSLNANLGAVVKYRAAQNTYFAVVKVVTSGGKHVIIEEPLGSFPSETFKTQLKLVA